MAVQIPQGVQRLKPQGSQSVGRVDVNVGDDGYVQTVGNIAKVLNTGDELINKYDTAKTKQIAVEDKVFDVKAKSAAAKIRDNLNPTLLQLTKGAVNGEDYGDRYNQFQQLKADQTDYAVQQYGGSPEDQERMRRFIYSELDVPSRQAEEAIFIRNQYMTLKANDASNKNATSDAVTLASQIDIKNTDAVSQVDAKLNKIPENVKSLAYHSGNRTTGEDGQPIYPAAIEQAATKAKADAVGKVIDNLMAVNQTEKAKFYYDKYNDELGSEFKTELKSKLTKAVENKENDLLANQIVKNNQRVNQFDEVEKIEDPEKKKKVSDLVNSLQIKEDKKNKAIQDNAFNIASDVVSKNQENPSARYYSVAEMKADPKILQVWNKMNTADKNAIEQSVVRPKISNEKKLEQLDAMMANDTLKNIPNINAVNREFVGLSPQDYSRYFKAWTQSTNPQSKGLDSGTRANMLTRSKELLRTAGVIKNSSSTGNVSDDSLKKWQSFQDELLLDFDQMKRSDYQPNSKQSQEYIKNKVNEFVIKNRKKGYGERLSEVFSQTIDKFGNKSETKPKDEPVRKKQDLIESL